MACFFFYESFSSLQTVSIGCERNLQSEYFFTFDSGLILWQVSTAKTCNCIYSMIQQRQRDIEYREAANETRQRFAVA